MTCKLKETYTVTFDNIDFTGRMTLNGVSKYMQVIAGDHADQLGINFFINNGHPTKYWILSKVKYVMDEYPKWEEAISFETYPGGCDKLFAVRLFDIYNGEDKKVGHIIADYLLMDIEKQRPVRIKGGEGGLKYLDFPYEGEKLGKLVAKGKVIEEVIRKAYYFEIDLNEHMNNSHYVRWSIDMLPIALLKENDIASLEINYNASITYGVEAKLTLQIDENGIYWVVGTSLDGKVQYFVTAITLRKRS